MMNRYAHWLLTMVSSVVALTALLLQFRDDEDDSNNSLSDQNRETKWAVSALSIAFTFSFFGFMGSKLSSVRGSFLLTAVEGALALVTCGFWAAVLPTLMHPDKGFAVTQTGGILNPNLYFFSWIGFIMAYVTLANVARSIWGSRAGISNNTNINSNVAGGEALSFGSMVNMLILSSFVTMISSTRLWQSSICSEDHGDLLKKIDELCNRTAFSISLGTLSAFICSLMVLFMMLVSLTDSLQRLMNVMFGLFVLTLWSFGAAYTTFGGRSGIGPGMEIGNLYFFTWGSFALSASLLASAVSSLSERDDTMTTNNNNNNTNDQEVTVEKGGAEHVPDPELNDDCDEA